MVLLVLWIASAGWAFSLGAGYYTTPVSERAFSDLHEDFDPAGRMGHGFGVIGSAMMTVGVAMYSIRKRVKPLRRVGRLNGWLMVHIFLCTLGPFLVLLHTSFKVGGLVAVAFWSMTIVVVSGIFGRYVYGRIPKSIHGQFLSLDAIQLQADKILETIALRSGLPPRDIITVREMANRGKPKGFVGAVVRAVSYDLTKRLRFRKIQRFLKTKGVPPNARRTTIELFQQQMEIEHRITLMGYFQRMFRYWHLLHLPLAVVMFAIMAVHIGVAILFGYAWVL